MHFSEISFSNNLETLKFKNSPFQANYVGASRGITKQVNSLPDSNFEKLATLNMLYENIRIRYESIRIAFGNRFIAFEYFKTFYSFTTRLIEKTKKETCLFFVLCKNESKILNKKKTTDRMNRKLI